MPAYKAPIHDMQFLMHEVLDLGHYCQSLPFYQTFDQTLIDPVLEEAARFTENVLFPLNQSGDKEGCKHSGNQVTTPKGFKEAYAQFVEGGWMSLNSNPDFGGQGLPKTLQVALDEMLCSSNVSFSLYTVLTQGTVHAIEMHASDEIKAIYLPKLISGEWTGTMCLTEAHCGTDLGMLTTKAEPQADGSYKLTGTKIFITSGEHDLADNIIHTVIARIPGSPEGIKGISLFVVPKFLVNADGSVGERNHVDCGSIEEKMGIKGSSTCVINFDHAQGYLIGEKNQGMRAMFSMMNLERLNIGLEGLGLAEVSYQNAVIYAKDRLQSRAIDGAKYPEKKADPIIVHPDVRRMLLDMRAFTEGARATAYWIGIQIDTAKHSADEKARAIADDLVMLLTPVIKAYFTDEGFECTNLGLQVYGGHGYIKEWGMEQYVRDARIAQIYEGTNGIQALDLVKRKLVMNKGKALNELREIINNYISQHQNESSVKEFIAPLVDAVEVLKDTSDFILQNADKEPELVGSAAHNYLHLLAKVVFAFMWAKMAVVASGRVHTVGDEKIFYQAKLHTARYFFARHLPEVHTLQTLIKAGSSVMMEMDEGMF